MISGVAVDASETQVEQLVELRLTRQKLLGAQDPPELWAVLDETALHRLVGGTATMRAQLETLAERSRLPKQTVQVIPLDAGAHPGMDSAFTILRAGARRRGPAERGRHRSG